MENAESCMVHQTNIFFLKLLLFSPFNPLARRETPAEGQRPEGEGANIDRRLVPYHKMQANPQPRTQGLISAHRHVPTLTAKRPWLWLVTWLPDFGSQQKNPLGVG